MSRRTLGALEREGKLVGLEYGQWVLYSEAQVVELLGEPAFPITDRYRDHRAA